MIPETRSIDSIGKSPLLLLVAPIGHVRIFGFVSRPRGDPPVLPPRSVATLSVMSLWRTIDYIRKGGFAKYWHDMQGIGDAKWGRMVGVDRWVCCR